MAKGRTHIIQIEDGLYRDGSARLEMDPTTRGLSPTASFEHLCHSPYISPEEPKIARVEFDMEQWEDSITKQIEETIKQAVLQEWGDVPYDVWLQNYQSSGPVVDEVQPVFFSYTICRKSDGLTMELQFGHKPTPVEVPPFCTVTIEPEYTI